MLDLDVDAMEKRLAALDREIAQYEGRVNLLREQVEEADERLATTREKHRLLSEAAAVINMLALQRERLTDEEISGLLTKGVRACMDEDIDVSVLRAVESGRPTVDFVVTTEYDGQELTTRIPDARGGGLGALVGFFLRAAQLILTPSDAPKVLVLDETFAQLSADHEVRTAEAIRELVDRSGIQVILVTHSDTYATYADTWLQFSLDRAGLTSVEVVRKGDGLGVGGA